MNTRIWAFVVYSVLLEAIIWGIFGWAVFVDGHSWWWILLAVYLSSAKLKGKHFGITKEAQNE